MLATTCPICDAQTEARPAQIAPFLVQICRLESATTNVRYCRKCDFAFFERRLTDEEAARLYHNYRGSEYNDLRISIEPSYINLANFMDDELGPYFVKRIDTYSNIMRLLPEIETGSVLDFGGDGKLAGRVFTNSKLSFDDLSAGHRINDSKFDLIFASQVFEHLSDIKKGILDLAERLTDDGVVIVDVPKEYIGTLSEGFLLQQKNGGALYFMHEHINHYSLKSIEELVKSAGLKPFFTVLPPHFRTILTIAAKPGSKVLQKLEDVIWQRKLLWHAQVQLDNTIDAQALIEGATADARAAHYYLKEIDSKMRRS